MHGSVRIDKHSVIMRIADQRNLEFSVRRNISVMSKKRQTNNNLRYDIALKTEKGALNRLRNGANLYVWRLRSVHCMISFS